MSDNNYTPLIDASEQKTSYKKYGAALGVTGLTVAAALLLAGRSKVTEQEPATLLQMPKLSELAARLPIDDVAEPTSTGTSDLWGYPLQDVETTCNGNFDRIAEMQLGGEYRGVVDANLVDGKFEDPSFPANTSSLYFERQASTRGLAGQVRTYEQYQNSYGITWKRPSELLRYDGLGGDRPSLWGKDGISPKASKQGALGDCWFLSSASAVAGVPGRIEKIFGQSEYSDDGAFETYFYVRGEKKTVIIDDRIPVLDLGTRYTTPYPPVNSKPSPAGAWWLVLLEKAFAKLNINYTQLNSGVPGAALRALTGMPVSSHQSNQMSDDELWSIVRDGTERRNPMAAACTVSHYNLIAGHAYGILKGLCLTDDNGDCVHKIVQMRNPWGLSKYTGPWSENSGLWTPEWKRQARLAEANEGEFWVPLNEWRALYSEAFNTHYRDDWVVSRYEGNPRVFAANRQVNGFVQFENRVSQDVVIDCVQNAERLFLAGCKTEYTP
jgi:hypothetical protein